MASAKQHKFGTDQQILAEFAKALSHPARIAILQTLAERKSCICGEIVEVMPLAQSTVSQHLKDLLDAGIIKGEIDGPRSCYCIDTTVLPRLAGAMEDFLHALRAATATELCCSPTETPL